jgi:prolipoprotein diacylglyceryl transferase
MRAFIPTPSVSYLSAGPFKIHFYALCIILGISAAILVGKRRLPTQNDLINDLAVYAIPSGIIGARIYHVLTTPEKYFNSHFLDAFKVWEGGLGIWGAISGGAFASYLVLRKRGLTEEFFPIADALAPGLLIAQAIGRLGNWFNGELFGRPTKMPWGLEIPISLRPLQYVQESTFHPTFLYEALWSLLLAVLLLNMKQRKVGAVFWLYVSGYSFGRIWVESLRSDYAHLILGVRLNVWVAIFFTGFGVWQYLRIIRKPVG